MTKLEGVSEVLRRSGHPPIVALDTDGASRVADAERFLDQENVDVQSRGWTFNARTNVTLTPGGDKRISIPAGVVTIDSFGKDTSRNVTQTGDTLFDLDDNTDLFTGTIVVSYVVAYQFHCVPHPIQKYIVLRAAAQFNQANGSPRNTPMIERDLKQAFVYAKRFDADTKDTNLLNASDVIVAKGSRIDSIGINGVV